MINADKIKDKAAEDGVSASLVFKEYAHFFILDYLFKKGMFSYLALQGGTALYGWAIMVCVTQKI